VSGEVYAQVPWMMVHVQRRTVDVSTEWGKGSGFFYEVNMTGMLLGKNELQHIIGSQRVRGLSIHITDELGTQLQFISSCIHAVLPTAQHTNTPAYSQNTLLHWSVPQTKVQVNERRRKGSTKCLVVW
jgi:hypothetical protein